MESFESVLELLIKMDVSIVVTDILIFSIFKGLTYIIE